MSIDSVLQGAVDMHCHSYPEFSLDYRSTRMEDVEALTMCRDYGLKGVVFKSHMFPTTGTAYCLQKLVPGITVYGSITLNACCGGLNTISVDAAAKNGAKVIHMPTWSTKWDLDNKCVSEMCLKKYIPSARSINASTAITALNEDGTLRHEVKEILKLAKELGLVVTTGHFSKEEGLKICAEAQKMNFNKLVWCHPLVIGATDEDLIKAASLGAYIEFTYLAMTPHYLVHSPQRVVDVIRVVGPEHIILTSDHAEQFSPPPAEMMRMWVATLSALGTKEEAIRTMIVDNQWKLLDIS